jgi:hypothetical protein
MDKIKFMKELSSSFSLYEAARWLSQPRKELKGETAAAYLKKNNVEPVHDLLKKTKNK